jgi:peptide subunit release factor 1 (eRF1)
VEPLEDALEEFSNLGVVLVDKQGARLFHFHLGELVEQQGFLGDLVKQVKTGGSFSAHGLRGGAMGGERAMKETIERNLRDIAETAVHFFEAKRVRRIMIGGTDENVSRFRSLLPKSLQSIVVGTFGMGMTASHADVLLKVMHTLQSN